MKLLIFLLLILFLAPVFPVSAQEQVIVPYTLADRDRAIRTEAKMEGLDAKMEVLEVKMDAKMGALESKMEVRFESVQKLIDMLSSMFFWGFGILIALFLLNFGFIIWDRRTALKPALDKADAADGKSTSLVLALRDYAQKHPDLANILKAHGLL